MPTTSDPSDIPLVPWPSRAEQRATLREQARACILVVSAGHPPPDDCTRWEDWVREPVDEAELRARRDTLTTLYSGHDCTPSVLAIFVALARSRDGRASRAEVRSAYEAAGGGASRGAFDAALSRLRRVLVDATIHTLSGGELLLERHHRGEVAAM